MKCFRLLLSVLLLAGAMAWSAAPTRAEEGEKAVISKVVADPDSDYCNLKFPAIKEDTLYWDRPVLKSADDGDIVDFSGPCNHDPAGKEEIERQRTQVGKIVNYHDDD